MKLIMENWQQYLKEQKQDKKEEEDPRNQAFRDVFRKASQEKPDTTTIRGVEFPIGQVYRPPGQEKQEEFIKHLATIGPDDWARPDGKGQLCKLFGDIVELTWRANASSIRDAVGKDKKIPPIGEILVNQSMPILKDLLKTITIELAYEYAPRISSDSKIGRQLGATAGGIKVPVPRAGYGTLKAKTKVVVNAEAYKRIYNKIKLYIVKRLLIAMIPLLGKAVLIYQLYKITSCAADAKEGGWIAKKYSKKLKAMMTQV